MAFCEATETPVLDFWWHLLWVSRPEWAALFILGRGIYDVIIQYVPWDSTLMWHLLTSWKASLSHLDTCKQALVVLKTRIWSQCETRQMLYWLSYARSASLRQVDFQLTCLVVQVETLGKQKLFKWVMVHVSFSQINFHLGMLKISFLIQMGKLRWFFNLYTVHLHHV